MKPQSSNLIGISSAVGASVFFTVNDTVIKFLSGDYALHQVILIRSIFALLFLSVILMPLMGGAKHLRTNRLPVHLLRGVFVVLANMSFFLGLAAMPIASATAIFFISPLVITGFSVIFLKEHVGARRWAAVFVGFLGVIIIVRPGSESFQMAALLPILAAFFIAGLHTLTRRIGNTESALTMAFYIQLIFIIVSAIFGLTLGQGGFGNASTPWLDFLTRAWPAFDWGDLWLFIIVGAVSAGAGFLISQAYRLCEAGLVAPFDYIALPLSVMWGWLIFDEWPDLFAWLGISLIIASGLYMAWREALSGRRIAGNRPTRR